MITCFKTSWGDTNLQRNCNQDLTTTTSDHRLICMLWHTLKLFSSYLNVCLYMISLIQLLIFKCVLSEGLLAYHIGNSVSEHYRWAKKNMIEIKLQICYQAVVSFRNYLFNTSFNTVLNIGYTENLTNY